MPHTLQRVECSGCGQEWAIMDCGGCGQEIEVEYVRIELLHATVTALRESAETVHRVSSYWEHAERSFQDCPAEACVTARTALSAVETIRD